MRFEDLPFLEVAEVESCHADGLAAWSGRPGFLNRDHLTSAVMSIRNGYFSTVAEVAAAYAFRIAKAHAFNDGNKRAAYLAARHFLAGAVRARLALDEPEQHELTAALLRAIEAPANAPREAERALALAFERTMPGGVDVVLDDDDP